MLKGHEDTVFSVAWSPDERRLATVSGHVRDNDGDNTVRIWDVDNWKPLKVLNEHENTIISVAWSPQGHLLASGDCDDRIIIWDAETYEPITKLDAKGWVRSLEWSSDGLRLAAATSNGTICIWDTISWDMKWTIEVSSGWKWHNYYLGGRV